MEKYTAFLGIISLFLIGADAGAAAPNTVTVPSPTIEAKPGDNIQLSCMGSSAKLDYYIMNRITWNFRDKDGREHPLVEGFYRTTKQGEAGKYANDNFRSGHLRNGYNTDNQYYSFLLLIQGVNHGDDGTYVCSLIDRHDVVLDSKTVTLTVLNPVEKLTLEVHDADTHKVLVKKTLPSSENETAVSLKPGMYMVICTATGSNPAPTMRFMYNEDEANVTLSTNKDTSGSRVQYSGSFSFNRFELKPMGNKDQFLTCSANIPGNHYPPKVAGIKMQVKVDIPDAVCANVTSMVNDRYVRLHCNVSSPAGGLECSLAKWVIGNTNEVIDSNTRYGNVNGQYDIMEADCEPVGEGLIVSLDIFKVKQIHFDTIYYMSYGIGKDAYRVPNQLMQKPNQENNVDRLGQLEIKQMELEIKRIKAETEKLEEEKEVLRLKKAILTLQLNKLRQNSSVLDTLRGSSTV